MGIRAAAVLAAAFSLITNFALLIFIV